MRLNVRRQPEGEGDAGPPGALRGEAAAVQFDDLLNNGHAEPGTRDIVGGVGAVEALAHKGGLLRRHADAIVGNGNSTMVLPSILRAVVEIDGAASWRILYRVAQHIGQVHHGRRRIPSRRLR